MAWHSTSPLQYVNGGLVILYPRSEAGNTPQEFTTAELRKSGVEEFRNMPQVGEEGGGEAKVRGML